MTTPTRKVLMVEESGAELGAATELAFDAANLKFSASGYTADEAASAIVEAATKRSMQTLSFADTGVPYLQELATSYSLAASFVFPGSAYYVPGAIIAIVSRSSGTSMNVRVYDATNAKTIAEKTGVTDTTMTLHSLGTLSNLPSAQAIFEVHIMAVGGGGRARISGLLVRA